MPCNDEDPLKEPGTFWKPCCTSYQRPVSVASIRFQYVQQFEVPGKVERKGRVLSYPFGTSQTSEEQSSNEGLAKI